MPWIDLERRGRLVAFRAVKITGYLSDNLTSETEVEAAADELKHQIDVAANRAKIALQSRPS